MKRLDSKLITPIYVKQAPDNPWPADSAFYALTGDGVFLCRNDRFFQSAVPARRPPRELAPQDQYLRVFFPLIPQSLLEQAVGYFDWAYRLRGAESVLLVGWNDVLGEVELIAPDQTAYSYRNANGVMYPESVRYVVPHPLPEGFVIFGDLHSHGDMSAYASLTDQLDDAQFNGLHLVVGRLADEPPQWHLEATVDGVRFSIPLKLVFAGYQSRNHDFPAQWRQRHTVQYSGYLGPVSGTSTSQAGKHGDLPLSGCTGMELGSPSMEPAEQEPLSSEPKPRCKGMTLLSSDQPLPPIPAANRTVKIIGLGGVGGMLVRPLCLLLASLHGTARIVLIDGDSFDPTRNAARMLFNGSGNKAATVREELLRYFANSPLSLIAVEEFVTSDNIERLIHSGNIVVLCVDNHRTRQLVNTHCRRLENVCLLSGGNDGLGIDSTGQFRRGTFGNVQVYLRRGGCDLCPSLAEYHPEIASAVDTHPAEASCVELVASSPQILPANVQTAAALLTTLYLYLCDRLHFSELTFDIGDATMGPLPLPAPAE